MRTALIILAAYSATALSACSGEDAADTREPAVPPAAGASPSTTEAPERTGVLRDPTPEQVRAIAADWLGRPIDHEAMAQAQPDYQRADAAERPAVLARLTEASRASAMAATDIGVLDVSTPISGVSYDRARAYTCCRSSRPAAPSACRPATSCGSPAPKRPMPWE